MDNNPFQLLTFIVAPAILTNASSILSLSTSNRFARTVDRSRFLYDKLKAPAKLTAEELSLYRKQLPVIGRRSLLLVRSLTWFYVSVGSFAATAFVSIVGAALTTIQNPMLSETGSEAGWIAAFVCGIVGVAGLVAGTSLMVMEMWLALDFMQSEVQLSESLQINPIL